MQFSCTFDSRSAGREGRQQSRAGAEETLAAVARSRRDLQLWCILPAMPWEHPAEGEEQQRTPAVALVLAVPVLPQLHSAIPWPSLHSRTAPFLDRQFPLEAAFARTSSWGRTTSRPRRTSATPPSLPPTAQGLAKPSASQHSWRG